MAKKRKAEHKQAVDKAPETPQQQDNPQQQFFTQLAGTLQQIDKNIVVLGENQDKLANDIAANKNRIAAVAKQAVIENQPKPMNPMDIMKMITDILNSPIVSKIADGIVGGKEEPINQNQVAPEGYEDFVAWRKAFQDLQLDNMREQIRKMKIDNDTAAKRAESDW